MPAAWVLAWWNLLFLAPLMVALLYLTIYVMSGVTFGDDLGVDHGLDADTDADLAGDAHLDTDAHADLDAEADADAEVGGGDAADHDADAHAGGDAEAGSGASPPLAALLWLGLGRVPLSILLMVFLLTWGASGFIVNAALKDFVPRDWMVALGSLPAALTASALVTRAAVRAMARWLPTHQTFVGRRSELVGTAGRALFTINDRFGMVALRDRRGDLFQVPCRVYADRDPIDKGREVLVVDYDAEKSVYYVTPYERDA